MAIRNTAALVFISSDSGEGYITVDGNEGDRKNLTAWHGGDQLVLAVAAQNNNTIVVVNSVGPLIVEPWIEHPNVTAVRECFLIISWSRSNYIVSRFCGLELQEKKQATVLLTSYTAIGIRQVWSVITGILFSIDRRP